MPLHAAIHHVTHYRYDRPVQLGPQVVRLRPAPHCRSKVISFALTVEPKGHFVNWQQDPFANYLARLVFPEKVNEFKVTVDLVVEMAVYNPFDFFLEPEAEKFPFQYDAQTLHELQPYLQTVPLGEANPLLTAYVQSVEREPVATIDFLVNLNRKVHTRYLIRMEPGVQTPEQTLALGQGSCRDSAWLLVNVLRHCGLAARFVSGYLIQLVPDVKALDGPSGTTVDFTDLHAWCEVYLPGAGWVGLDATSGLMAGEGHIPLACTPEPSNAAPIEGLVEAAQVQFAHEMKVSRLLETPRVTKPYADAQWDAILTLGEQVDAQLKVQDVRLTMGGEPTFVAVSDRDAPEWNTAAQGPTKRIFALDIMHRLQARYGQGGFVHIGQGKWYPGEQLPRWAFSVFWRADGRPVWQNPALLADERSPQKLPEGSDLRFVQQLAQELGLPKTTSLPASSTSPALLPYLHPAHEDPWYYLWRENRLPVNVNPLDSHLADPLERKRLAHVFQQGLGSVVGYVMPLQALDEPPDVVFVPPVHPAPLAAKRPPTRWQTGVWHLRNGNLSLVPGDSPLGYRLPLDTLPWVHPDDVPALIENDPMTDAGALKEVDSALKGRPSATDDLGREPKAGESARWVPRTALCVQVRDIAASRDSKGQPIPAGQALYVFMPPVARLESYLDLVQAIERAAQASNLPVVMEGYPPPRDPRLKMLQVTPDPGVVEVNIQPVDNWRDLVANTEFLYDAAFESRLSAEKFMLDGKHTGTGGGNHFVMGGLTPADSPFLRKPELLASLLCHWINHPSLSYLFSGVFIGPTSQSPRVDEARNDQVYELEIALAEIAKASAQVHADKGLKGSHAEVMAPWLIDRTLRNLLVDVTGNTHRSEFCIDKLYSPDSSTGRLGLLELRSFEMPPHARMSVVQQLLLRAFIAHFWDQPRITHLTRWGTQLHDKFLLPHFVWQDLEQVVAELNQAGYAFDLDWFAPHFEFRFPLIGSIQTLGMELTLRTALEPWHVMGEEGSAGGTVRNVDSSLERVQVSVRNFNPTRYQVWVNGVVVPLRPTGVAGEMVAGVRYVAWKPYSALHPSIGVQAPLIFEIRDTWSDHTVGGCEMHVAHPGGRNYETFPVNANEAESRRLANFVPMGHSAHHPTPPSEPVATAAARLQGHGVEEFPFTLDLRRAVK